MKMNGMKFAIAAIFAVCLFCASNAHAQLASVLPNHPQPLQMQDNVQHASEHSMGRETTLLSANPYLYAQGEIPLAELGSPLPYQKPLGDVARDYRKGHADVPKAVVTLEK